MRGLFSMNDSWLMITIFDDGWMKSPFCSHLLFSQFLSATASILFCQRCRFEFTSFSNVVNTQIVFSCWCSSYLSGIGSEQNLYPSMAVGLALSSAAPLAIHFSFASYAARSVSPCALGATSFCPASGRQFWVRVAGFLCSFIYHHWYSVFIMSLEQSRLSIHMYGQYISLSLRCMKR